jgi:hypothetical protein
MDYFVGDWKVIGEGPLGPIEGRWSAEWSPGKVCLLIHYPGPDPEEFLGKGILGWNSQKKEILAQMFYSIDAHETISYKVDPSGSWEASYSGASKRRIRYCGGIESWCPRNGITQNVERRWAGRR